MHAKVKYTSDRDGHEVIEVNGHVIQFGGAEGDGFCYGHQSFVCINKLTEEEWSAVRKATAVVEEK